jgi:hypothetical protein
MLKRLFNVSGRRARNIESNGIPAPVEEFNNGMLRLIKLHSHLMQRFIVCALSRSFLLHERLSLIKLFG